MKTAWFEGIEELYKLSADLKNGSVRNMLAADQLVRSATYAVQRYAITYVPVDTGELRTSITAEFQGGILAGYMDGLTGPEAAHGAYVEYGTSRMAPKPYMMPALVKVIPGYLAAAEALSNPLAKPGAGVSAGGRF